ncbi:hypothetical protein ATO3_21865 [Marinibacterium profundimaris]|uniref:Rhodanese domain-containing protein n=2 Tax=Marinibacterium profundimaris TaxID=1679460 RepID=A0A225NEN3_9RHOB|nr:hypothetical protein ATO3_21865 [Marinibacterium profundimaris]
MTQDFSPPVRLARRDLLVFGLVGAAVGLLSYSATRPLLPDRAGSLTATEAFELAQAGQITLIDIRRPDEWAATGIAPAAHPLDMRREDFADRLAEIADPGQPVALICARGVRSARMSQELTTRGIGGIIDIPEGMIGSAAGPGWIARDLPVTPYEGDQG